MVKYFLSRDYSPKAFPEGVGRRLCIYSWTGTFAHVQCLEQVGAKLQGASMGSFFLLAELHQEFQTQEVLLPRQLMREPMRFFLFLSASSAATSVSRGLLLCLVSPEPLTQSLRAACLFLFVFISLFLFLF